MRYVIHAVEASGISSATYELECDDDACAAHRATQLLQAHTSVEIWKGTKRLAQLQREPTAPTSIAGSV